MYRIGYILYFSIYCKVPKLFSRLYDFLSTFFIDAVKFRLEYISIHSSVFSCVHKVYTFFSWLGVLERFTTSKLPLFRFFFKKIRTFLWKIFNNFFFVLFYQNLCFQNRIYCDGNNTGEEKRLKLFCMKHPRSMQLASQPLDSLCHPVALSRLSIWPHLSHTDGNPLQV